MKKLFKVFVALIFLSAGMLAPTGLSAQQSVVKVQGHPHELLTKKAAEGTARTAVSAAPADISYIDPDDIVCWIDQPKLSPYLEIDSAVLMIKFTDGQALDSLFVWGYRWNPYEISVDTLGNVDTVYVQRHGIDLLRAVANNDQRLLAMIQYTGKLGHTVGGLGINWNNDGTTCSRPDLILDVDAASADPNVRFVYTNGGTPDCADGQVSTPTGASNIANFATVDMMNDGILEHPFDAGYGYPAYDYDHWIFNPYITQENMHWQAGWYTNGFWGYYRAGNWRVPVPSADPDNDPDAALLSVTYEPLLDKQVQGFVFETNFNVHYFDGEPVYVSCRCAPCPTNALLAPVNLSARERIVTVQGHPHELLTQQASRGTAKAAVAAAPTDTVYIDPDDIVCWIDEPGLNPELSVDSAYLVIKWTDHKALDSVFVWGYRWNPIDAYVDRFAHHSIDMLRTVSNNDKRLITLLQDAGMRGHSVGGIGLNWGTDGTDCYRIEVDFDIASAQKDQAWIDFRYFDDPNCYDGQVAVPVNPNNSLTFAKLDYRKTGILPHPFSAKFGIPAEDFDYWSLSGYLPDTKHWQSGWVHQGYWAYYRADNRRVPIPTVISVYEKDPEAAEYSVTYEPLRNQQVHGFVFRPTIDEYSSEYELHQFDGELIFMNCRCAPCTNNVTTKTK
jgi:hypothetical protein